MKYLGIDPQKPKIAIFDFTSCEGCQLQLVNKEETLDAAFLRLTEVELGQSVSWEQASFLGVYEHFYNDNFQGTGFSTHYVVLAYNLSLPFTAEFPEDQHEAYSWFSSDALLADDLVHSNSKAYFMELGV